MVLKRRPIGYEDEPRLDRDEDLLQFGAGLSAGVDTTLGTLGGVRSLFNSITGDEEEALEYLNYAQQKFQEASEAGGTVTSIEEIDGAADFIRWATYSAGTILPSIATSIVGGGVGGAVAQSAAKKFAKDRIQKEVKDAVEGKVSERVKQRLIRETLDADTAGKKKFGQIAGAFGASAAQNTGATFVDIYEETGIEAPDVALGAGVLAGALDSVVPLKTLKKIMPDTVFTKFKDGVADRLVKNGGVTRRVLLEGTKAAGLEGFTEAAQELVQATAVGMMRNDPQGGLAEYYDEFVNNISNPDDQLVSRLLNAAAVGAIGGATTGGITGALNRQEKRVKDPRAEEDKADKEDSPEATEEPQEAGPLATPELDERDPETQQKVEDAQADQREARRRAQGIPQSMPDIQPTDIDAETEARVGEAQARQRQAARRAQGLPDQPVDRSSIPSPEEARNARYEQDLSESLRRSLQARKVINEIIPASIYETGDATPEENQLAGQEAERITVLPSGPTIEIGPDRTMESLNRRAVDYNGIQGTLTRREDGVYVVITPDGNEVVVESGESDAGSTAAAMLGVRPVDIDVDTPAPEIQYNPEDQTFVSRGKTYRYLGTRYDDDGKPIGIDAETMDGQSRVFRSQKTIKAMEAAQARLQMAEMQQTLATAPAQFDDLPTDLQMAVYEQREATGADQEIEQVTQEEVEAAIAAAPAEVQADLREQTEALFSRTDLAETPIGATFAMDDQWREFEGSIVRAGEKTLEQRQQELDVLAGQTVKQANGDDAITIPSTGIEQVAERISTLMQRPLQFVNPDTGDLMEVGPATRILDMGGDSDTAIEDVKQAAFDLIANGMPSEFVTLTSAIAAHGSRQLPETDGAATRGGISLDIKLIGSSRTETGAKELRWTMAHEGWHVIDLNYGISESLPSFDLDIIFAGEGPTLEAGDVITELYENYQNRTELGQVFTYPFYQLAEAVDDFTIDVESVALTTKREVFAQLGAIYVSNPRLLKSQAPQAYEVIRTIRDNPTLATGDEDGDIQNTEAPVQPEGTGVQGEVRPPAVSGRPEVEADGGTGEAGFDGVEAGQADQGVGGETQQETGDRDRRVVRPEDLSIKRSANFATEGTYDVTFPDGSVEQIYRDTDQFSSPTWRWDGAEGNSVDDLVGIGSNRAEAIQRLITLKGFDLPKIEGGLFMRGPTGRAYQGLPANETLGGEDRVQTSLPNGTRLGEKYYVIGKPEDHSIGIDRILTDQSKPPLKEKLQNTINGYDFFTPSRPDLTPEETIEEFKNHMVNNLLWLHDQMDPNVRQEAKQWYDGARKQVDIWVDRYGLEPRQVAAVVANLSPQKDWFMNMSLAERMLDIFSYRQDFVADADMNKAFTRIVLKDTKGKLIQVSKLDKKAKDAFKLQRDIWSKIKNQPLSGVEQALSPEEVNLGQAIWIRMYDEAKHSRKFRVMSPSGEIMGLSMGKDGPQSVAWGSFTEIMKGVQVLRDGSLESVSLSLGDAHKVRNFYNNIVSPNSELGEVTIDTHAVAAALFKPLSAKGYEVSHAFGSTPKVGTVGIPDGVVRAGAGSSAKIGAGGTYGIIADAYREAAEQLGILPRQLQSITWEEIRVIYPASFKDEKGTNLGKINDLWARYANDELSIDEVREQAYGLTGTKGNKPVWAGRSNAGANEEQRDGTYSRDVYSTGVSRSRDRGRDVGSGSDVDVADGASAGGLAATVKVGKPNTKVRPSVRRAYAALQAGQITRQEYDEAVLETIRPYEAVPTPATEEEMISALANRQKERVNAPLEQGERVGLRLDINAYENFGTWVPTIHDARGKPKSHMATAAVTGADFTDFKQGKSQKVMEGGSKTPFAQIKGAYVNRTDEENVRLAQQYLNDPEWRQVGFDPRRHATFYDRRTGEAVASADEVIQVGPLVLAKNAVTLDVDEVLFSRRMSGSRMASRRENPENASRRKFLTRAATAAVVTATGGNYTIEALSRPPLVRGKAKPISDFVDRPLPESAMDALRNNDLISAIDAAVEGAPEDVMSLATNIKSLLPDASEYQTEIVEGSWNLAGSLSVSGTPTLKLYPDSQESGHTATLLHEAMHLAIASRYRSINDSAAGNFTKLEMEQPKARAALEQWYRLFNEYRMAVYKFKKDGGEVSFAADIAAGDPDEFFVRALTEPETQKFLHSLDYKGKTLYEKFKDWVKKYLFGSDTGTQPTWLDAALTGAGDLLSAAQMDSPDFAFMNAVNSRYARRFEQALFQKKLSGQTQTHEEASENNELMDGTPSTADFTLDDETRIEKQLIKWQDKYLVVKKFEKRVAEVLGIKELPEQFRTYDAETLHSGKIKSDFDGLEQDYVKPIGDLMRDGDVTMEEVGSYLMAKHAEERNRYIASINPSMPDGGSGMTTQQAKDYLASAENKDVLEEISTLVYKMLDENRQRMVEFGLIDEGLVTDVWQQNYKFYVPLKGFAAQDEGDGNYTMPRGLPKGFSVGGREFMSALGRDSKSANPLLFALSDVENKIVRSRRNEVAQKFLSLAELVMRAGSDQLTVYRDPSDYPMKRVKRDGRVVLERMDEFAMADATMDDGKTPRFLSVKQNGKQVFVEIKNQSLARAMHNVGAEAFENLTGVLDKGVNRLQWFQNFRRNMLINYNPSWFLINPIRDLQTGIMYALSEGSKEGGLIEGENLTADILKTYFSAGRAYFANSRGKGFDEELDAYFEEYQNAGAPTGLTLTRDIEEQKKRLANIISEGKLPANIRKVGKLVEDLNTSSENVVRFATYVAARRRDVPVDKAAILAKNLTVNFNRKGELSAGLNLFYLFFNAAIQGTANIAQAMTGKTADDKFNKAQLAAGGMALIAYLVTEHNLMTAGEDDDGESLYNDLTDYDKMMSWNIAYGDGFIQFPMPYGYGLFHTLGRLGAEWSNDAIDGMGIAAEITAATVHHLLPPPLGFVGSIGKVDDGVDFLQRGVTDLMPDIVEPAVALGFNKTHFGSPIYIEQNPLMESQPDSSLSKRTTEKFYKDVAEFFNKISNGSLYRSGGIDVSPDTIKYLTEYAFGGVGRFFSRSGDVIQKYNDEVEGNEVTLGNAPIARYFWGEPSTFEDKMEYYENIRAAQEVFNEAEATAKNLDPDFVSQFGGVIKLEPLYKEIQKQLRALRRQKKQIEKAQSDPTKAYDQIQKLEERMQVLYDRFNKRYREATR